MAQKRLRNTGLDNNSKDQFKGRIIEETALKEEY